ncbi:MAG TPA: hypothetical protein VIG48_05005 [Jatrophihabitans sp.]
MSDAPAGTAPHLGEPSVPADPPPSADPVAERRAQLRAAGAIVLALSVLGAVLGGLWEAWSPPGPAAAVLTDGVQPDETEAWVAGDGRYALIVIVVGILAGVAAWYLPRLRAVRGPYVALGLAVGGVLGAALTDLVGWALRGDGNTYKCSVGSCIDHLPLTVHIHGLWFVEAFLAVLVYGLFVAFAVADDLGRPDTVRRSESAAMAQGGPADRSVQPEGRPQDGWGHGDAAGPA